MLFHPFLFIVDLKRQKETTKIVSASYCFSFYFKWHVDKY